MAVKFTTQQLQCGGLIELNCLRTLETMAKKLFHVANTIMAIPKRFVINSVQN